MGNVYPKFIDYIAALVKNEITLYFLIKSSIILARVKNCIIYYGIYSISFSEISAEKNNFYVNRFLL